MVMIEISITENFDIKEAEEAKLRRFRSIVPR